MYSALVALCFLQLTIIKCSAMVQNPGLIEKRSTVEEYHGLDDILYFGSSSFFLVKEAVSWVEAEQSCRSRGAHLASITNETLQQNIVEYIQNQNTSDKDIWIGLTDIDDEGEWVWVKDGEPMNYSNWMTGEPSDSCRGEDCVILKFGHGYKWGDRVCHSNSQKHYHLCEIERRSEYSTTATTVIQPTAAREKCGNHNKLPTQGDA